MLIKLHTIEDKEGKRSSFLINTNQIKLCYKDIDNENHTRIMAFQNDALFVVKESIDDILKMLINK